MKLEGKNAVAEALQADIKINKLLIINKSSDEFVQKVVVAAKQKGIAVYFVAKDVLDKESLTSRHQGLIGFIDDFKYTELDDILQKVAARGQDAFFLILDGIEDPHNLGSIIRTAECAGVHGVIIPKNRACGVNETVVRTSAGSVNHIPVAQVTNINMAIKSLKEKGIFCYAMEAGGELIYQSNLKGNIALVVGSEGYGVSKLTKELCDQVISLPMFGKINSLNASVAAALGVYEALKQRKF